MLVEPTLIVRERSGPMSLFDRSYPFLAFDWDGTAVSSRERGAADRLLIPLAALIEAGAYFYVVTGTRHDWPARQLAGLDEPAKEAVFLCCNRGSEVYVLGPGAPRLVLHREAATAEKQAMDTVAGGLVEWLAACGVESGRIDDRLNRIKVDLIPEWPDPPKHRIGELQQTVKERLRAAGGLAAVFEEADRLVAETGLDLRVTSDVKHIEVGLTDKSHSMAWIVDHLRERGGELDDLLVVGDEFGPVGGAEGSDAKTVVRGATVVSVGEEPNGVPVGVVHLGGGPERFLGILEELVQLAGHDVAILTAGHERRRA